ncbi:MAG: tRNA (adenosine(37)-N6)-threonylcarbamoyltransferase complex transferase subunit TsaD [Planctomycetes bacterium]|nr:tRNA (adenosine(37)-N6)-threonylcarbamoyltransferase complex transferase subunit TsaD [Planctomycetota bacterium]
MNLLGIETSCDETAAAVVRDGREVLSNVVCSQQILHGRYGGVVPELACRAHIEAITPAIQEALGQAGLRPGDLDAVAVTHAPGLVGALLVGVTAAKTMAWRLRIPLVPVHHVEAHIYANRLDGHPSVFPAVALVVSGGHTLLFRASSEADLACIGSTRDDAAGEAFDKVAAILGLGYPGGPAIDRVAARGHPAAIPFPRTFLEGDRFDFSFSGIKTAVLYHVKGQNAAGRAGGIPKAQEVADIAASFQEAMVDVLVVRTFLAAEHEHARAIYLGGGVACNSRLRQQFLERAGRSGIPVFWPRPALCTDNAAMIAGLGYHHWRRGRVAGLMLDAVPTPPRTMPSGCRCSAS